MSLLSIAQDVCREVGVPVPSSVINNSDATVQQVLAMINKSGKHHMKNYVFEALTKEANFTTVATEEQGALTTIASDYDRIVGRTMYDRSNTWKVHGPVSPQQWQQRKGSQITGGTRNVFRIRGGKILFNPIPDAGKSVYFEYITKQWVQNEAGDTFRTAFSDDTDEALLDEEMLTKDVIWRFLGAKGFAYGEQFRDYQIYRETLVGTDGSNEVLDMSAPADNPPVLHPAVPDGSWDV